MATAFKPTKRELVKMLVNREIDKIRTRLAEIDRESQQLNLSCNGCRETDRFIAVLSQLPLSPQAQKVVDDLRSIGLNPVVNYRDKYEDSVGMTHPVATVSAHYSAEFPLEPTKGYVHTKLERAELRKQYNQLADERSKLQALLHDQQSLHARVLGRLPDGATPHLEVLCEMLGVIIYNADMEQVQTSLLSSRPGKRTRRWCHSRVPAGKPSTPDNGPTA
jgi:hypothetical protein